jgi:hypothetical protein
MKYLVLTLAAALMTITSSFACTVCKSQQLKLLRGITHGAGPESDWDYVIVAVSVVMVLATLIGSVWQLAKPGEKSAAHIKRSILNTEA